MKRTTLLTFRDVAEMSQLPVRTVYYLHQTGRGPKTVNLGRHLRVKATDFDEWLSAGNRLSKKTEALECNEDPSTRNQTISTESNSL